MDVIGRATFEEVNFILSNGRDLLVTFSIECTGDCSRENEYWGSGTYEGSPSSVTIDWDEPDIIFSEVFDENGDVTNLNEEENKELETEMSCYAQSRTDEYEYDVEV